VWANTASSTLGAGLANRHIKGFPGHLSSGHPSLLSPVSPSRPCSENSSPPVPSCTMSVLPCPAPAPASAMPAAHARSAAASARTPGRMCAHALMHRSICSEQKTRRPETVGEGLGYQWDAPTERAQHVPSCVCAHVACRVAGCRAASCAYAAEQDRRAEAVWRRGGTHKKPQSVCSDEPSRRRLPAPAADARARSK
jgi:hypothetical protein